MCSLKRPVYYAQDIRICVRGKFLPLFFSTIDGSGSVAVRVMRSYTMLANLLACFVFVFKELEE